MFTVRYDLGLYRKQITFRPLNVKITLLGLIKGNVELERDLRGFLNTSRRKSSYYAENGNKAKGYETKFFTAHNVSFFTFHTTLQTRLLNDRLTNCKQ